MARVHVCQEPLCRKVIPINEKYCDKHQRLHPMYQGISVKEKKQLNKTYNLYERDEEANKFYHSSQWTKVRNYVVSRDMYQSGVTGKVLNDKEAIVDHVHPRRLVENSLDTSNLWILSRTEHNIKTKIEESLAKKPNGDNILKHMTKETWIKYILERLN